MHRKILFFGIASTYTNECIEIASRLNLKIEGFIHNQDNSDFPKDLKPLYLLSEIGGFSRSTPVVIPLITPTYRKIISSQLEELEFYNYFNLVHPSSNIATSSFWREGFNVNAGVDIGSNCSFGKHVLINRSVSIGHDVTVGNYATFGPG